MRQIRRLVRTFRESHQPAGQTPLVSQVVQTVLRGDGTLSLTRDREQPAHPTVPHLADWPAVPGGP
jgi:hypothetical protein